MLRCYYSNAEHCYKKTSSCHWSNRCRGDSRMDCLKNFLIARKSFCIIFEDPDGIFLNILLFADLFTDCIVYHLLTVRVFGACQVYISFQACLSLSFSLSVRIDVRYSYSKCATNNLLSRPLIGNESEINFSY